MGRYGKSCEQRFRQNFSKDFDWCEFNLSLSERILTGDRKAIAIDPSYISKSGKCTPWIGYFWSGTAGQAKRGLEILGVGLIDIDNKDCISLQAVQTPDSQTLESNDIGLIDWYLLVLKSMEEKLHKISPYVVADAYFSKSNFVSVMPSLLQDLCNHRQGMFRSFLLTLMHLSPRSTLLRCWPRKEVSLFQWHRVKQ